MENKYEGLKDLIESDPESDRFFNSLPDYIQGGIMLYSDSIKSELDLRSCAAMIIREFE
ncbi:MAG: hypothetical protein ACI4KF_04890 [Huintestinicola sp.]